MYDYYYVDLKLVDAALYYNLLANTTDTIINRNTTAYFHLFSLLFKYFLYRSETFASENHRFSSIMLYKKYIT